MRMSIRFGKTLREKPAEAELVSHELMLRGAYIARLAAGIYSFMPFAWRSVKKIEDIMRREMDAIEGQEVSMPVVHPASIWQESGRWFDVGPEMVRFKDRSGRDMVLGMTHEEPVTDLAKRFVDSYKQLPFVLYQIQTKFRDEPRARGGLIRVREFVMKDAYSFHRDQEDLDAYYPLMCRAYRRICQSTGVPVTQVASDVGMMGGSAAHEFMYITDAGEDTLILCPECGYAANREVATLSKRISKTNTVAGQPRLVETPECSSITKVAEFLGVPVEETMKTMVYSTKKGPVVVVIRGDLDINERKLANAVKENEVHLADPEELSALGWIQGFMSPWNLQGAITVIADESLKTGGGFVAGANKNGYHAFDVVPERDFAVNLWTDVASARQGDPCPVCGHNLDVKRGIEIGNTFKLGTKYSKAMGLTYKDEDGNKNLVVMGCYGMGVGRLLACAVEANHDENGIVWPISIAPYHIHIVALGNSEEIRSISEQIYQQLVQAGHEVLLDDRDESAGVKFNDADLLGIPIRMTVSSRSLKQGGVEIKLRREEDRSIIKLEDLAGKIEELKAAEFSRFIPMED